jgi:uncharacterized protein YbaR (Trm112 family)
LITVLACPKCGGDLIEKGSFLTCEGCGIAYPILGDIPDMLISDSWDLTKARKAKFKHKLKL